MKSWRDNIRNVVPYTPGEQPKEDGVIKLNTNENPYPPSPKVLEAINHIKHLRKYPDPAAADSHRSDQFLLRSESGRSLRRSRLR